MFTRRDWQGLILASLLQAVAGTTIAEVRAFDAGAGAESPSVRVKLTDSGPWSTSAPIDERLLNPHGDLLGDNLPSCSPLGQFALCAWHSPRAGSLELAVTEGRSWHRLNEVPVGAIIGTPHVVAVDAGGWLVFWQEASGSGGLRARCVGVGPEAAVGEPLEFGEESGSIVDVLPLDDGARLVRIDGRGEWLTITDIGVRFVPQIPIPVPTLSRTFEFRSGAGELRPGPILPQLAPAAHDVVGAGDLLTWWSSPRTLSFVELAADGPVLPVETIEGHGRSEHPQGLINEAKRTMRKRSD